MAKITQKRLKELGFKCEKERDEENELKGLWYKEGVMLYQNYYNDEFLFATSTDEDGEFKSGYVVPTDKRLNLLYEGLTGRKLIK